MNKGVLYAVGAYLLWGVLPLYWKALQVVPATHILAHRTIWSAVFLLILVLARKELPRIKQILKKPRLMLILFGAACLLSVNWLIYIWGVNAGFIVETSLGYYINPLLSIVLGMIFLRERLRPWQWLPVGLATIAVIYLTVSYGALPWIALGLALTFGLYGLVKKTVPIDALHSLTLETGMMFIPALIFILIMQSQGRGALGSAGALIDILLVFTGLVTALPLLLFGMGARLIPLSTIGILQYIAPTIQFLIGVLIYQEDFDQAKLIGFGMIWIALIIFSVEGFLEGRKRSVQANEGKLGA